MASSTNELRIVLIGKTGTGKSATGNSLLSGRAGFKNAQALSSVTTKCDAQTNYIKDIDKKLVVVDTPGFCDTDPTRTDKIIKKKITEQIFNLTSPGVHAFLIVLSNSRFTPEDQKTIDLIEEIFGAGAARYCIVVFTHLDELKDDPDYLGLDQLVQTGPEGVQELVKKCGGRKFAINNKLRDQNLEKQLKGLVKMIDDVVRMNNGKCYTNAEYERIEKERQMEKERKEKEEREKAKAREEALIEKGRKEEREKDKAREEMLIEKGRKEEREKAAATRSKEKNDQSDFLLERMSHISMLGATPPMACYGTYEHARSPCPPPTVPSHGGQLTGDFFVSTGSANGRAIFVGPRGGHFINTSAGQKRYI